MFWEFFFGEIDWVSRREIANVKRKRGGQNSVVLTPIITVSKAGRFTRPTENISWALVETDYKEPPCVVYSDDLKNDK